MCAGLVQLLHETQQQSTVVANVANVLIPSRDITRAFNARDTSLKSPKRAQRVQRV
jgi:hypothetical protein